MCWICIIHDGNHEIQAEFLLEILMERNRLVDLDVDGA
jgi:hypothetical protein